MGADRGFFVTGTDTHVGKTVVSAWLVRVLSASYWKPIQCGVNAQGKTDRQVVEALSGVSASRVFPETYVFSDPVSPHEAARRAGKIIDLKAVSACPSSARPLIIEGAGGALVPINHHQTMMDIMVRLRLPVFVVVWPRLGSINHSLLTLEALRARDVSVAGVIVSVPPEPHVRDAIKRFGNTDIIAELPQFSELTADSLGAAARDVPDRWPFFASL